MGHPSTQVLQYLPPLLSCSFDFNKIHCDVYHRSKQYKLPFSISDNKAEEPFGVTPGADEGDEWLPV